MMLYTINTYVNRSQEQAASNNLLTVMVFVDSLSNYQQANISSISSQQDFDLCFPDSYQTRSKSLDVANKILAEGYSLLALNIRTCKHYEALRIYRDKDGVYRETWFDPYFDIPEINTKPHSDKHLAVKFKLSDLKNGKYLLLESMIGTYISNTLVYTSDKIPINSNNYSPGQCFRYFPENGWTELKTILSMRGNYICYYTPEDDYVHIAYPYEIDIPEWYNENRIHLQYDEAFQYIYISAIHSRDKCIDFTSKYKSDIGDIMVECALNGNVYNISVHKLNGSGNIIYSESYYDKDLVALYQRVNSMSKLLTLTSYEPVFVPGKFYLKQMYPVSELGLEDYYRFLNNVKELVDEGYTFSTNFIYEPELDISKDEQLKLQECISNTFENDDNFSIKVFTYLGKINKGVNCYFADKTYNDNASVYPAKRLGLSMLLNGQGAKSLKGFSAESDATDGQPLPFFINDFSIDYFYVTAKKFGVIYNDNYYDVRDLLLISTFNNLLNNTNQEKTIELMYAIIELINSRFEAQLGYSPAITLTAYSRQEDSVHVSIRYNTSDMRQVSNLDLILDIK